MTTNEFSDETLMAFADGELDAAAAARVEAAINDDPSLAERVALFIQTRKQVSATLKPLSGEPVPPALEASVRRLIEEARARETASAAENVVAFRPRTQRPGFVTRYALPLAASLAAIAAGAIGYMAGTGGNPSSPAGLQVAGLDRPALTRALETVASGEEIDMDGERFRAIATFRDDAGTLCREFEVDLSDRNTVVSVACRPENGWNVNFAVVAPGVDSGYAPASSTESLDAYLVAIGAGAPIGDDEERAALEALR